MFILTGVRVVQVNECIGFAATDSYAVGGAAWFLFNYAGVHDLDAGAA